MNVIEDYPRSAKFKNIVNHDAQFAQLCLKLCLHRTRRPTFVCFLLISITRITRRKFENREGNIYTFFILIYCILSLSLLLLLFFALFILFYIQTQRPSNGTNKSRLLKTRAKPNFSFDTKLMEFVHQWFRCKRAHHRCKNLSNSRAM